MGAAPDCHGEMDETHLMGALGDSKCWPPGFRFHPTDEELVLYYLKRKICGRRIKPPMIGDVDVYKHEPWELPEKSVLRSGDKQWYFFTPRDRKYPNGSRSNRATKRGYWKATGKDRTISQNSKPVGNKKTLVYYQGRAPKGQRTDWVMHEYAMEEQALVGFINVQDCYALYKVFRKSGPGPKNGEQYGAPFIEEEWHDDETADECVNSLIDWEPPSLEHGNCDSTQAVSTNVLPIDNLEHLLLQMSDQLDTDPQLHEGSAYVSEFVVETEIGSIVPESQIKRFSLVDTDTWCEPSVVETSSQNADSISTCYQPTERPKELSFAPSSGQGQMQAIEEFLEINDINNSESINRAADCTGNQNPGHNINELYDPDEYFDASMFLAEVMAPLDGTTSGGTYSYFVGFEDETQFHYPHITSDLWTHDQNFTVPTSVERHQVAMESPSSGALYASTVSNSIEQPLGQVTQELGVSTSWFGSKISAFLDSVPSSPAFASENTLINRALERMSSFGAVQSRMLEQNAQTGRDASAQRRRGGLGGGFLFISLLGGLGAIFWVLIIGAVVKLFKGLWGRFIAS